MNPSERGEPDNARPSLERPSLFAGDATAPASGLRILSTLESQEKTPQRRRVGDGRAPARDIGTAQPSWWSRMALWGLVGGGLAAVIGGLWLSQEQGPTNVNHQPASHQVIHVSTPTAAAPPLVPPGAQASAAPLAALIENTPTGAGPTDRAPLSSLADEPQAPTPSAKPKAAPPHTEAKRSSHSGKHKPKAHDEDVALLEAMFTHAGQRPSPGSASQALEHECGPLSGAQARQCRQRVCRQHPDAKVCH